MAATATPRDKWGNTDNTNNHFVVNFTVALTGNYGGGATHGDTLDLSKMPVSSRGVPFWVELHERPPAGTAPTGYTYTYCPGTTQANGVLAITNGTAEYTQGSAYSSGLLAAVIVGKAWFSSLV